MADLNVTVANVAVITAGTASLIPTVTAHGVAGGTVTPGQVLYADPSANNQLKPAIGTVQLQAANVVGIALGSATPNQPLTYAIAGDIAWGTGTTLMSGSVYLLSGTAAGNMVAVGDANAPGTSGWPGTASFVTMVGIGNGGSIGGSASALRVSLIPAAVPL